MIVTNIYSSEEMKSKPTGLEVRYTMDTYYFMAKNKLYGLRWYQTYKCTLLCLSNVKNFYWEDALKLLDTD